MGLLFVETLPGPKVFKCKCCKVDSASQDEIVSKDFRGRFGRAYLFERVVNVSLGPNEERHLLSGLHTVNDIYCSSCQQILGWRYSSASPGELDLGAVRLICAARSWSCSILELFDLDLGAVWNPPVDVQSPLSNNDSTTQREGIR